MGGQGHISPSAVGSGPGVVWRNNTGNTSPPPLSCVNARHHSILPLNNGKGSIVLTLLFLREMATRLRHNSYYSLEQQVEENVL